MGRCTTRLLKLEREVKRIELLLFHSPMPDLLNLDKFITGILNQGCYEGSDEEKAYLPSETVVPESCEVYCIDDDSSHGDGVIQQLFSEVCVPSECEQTYVHQTPENDLVTARLITIENDIERLKSNGEPNIPGLDELFADMLGLEAKHVSLQDRMANFEDRLTCLSGDIVQPITSIVKARMEECQQLFQRHEEAIVKITESSEKHENQIGRVLDLVEQSHQSPGIKEAQKKKRR